jgi:hypothetical protein
METAFFAEVIVFFVAKGVVVFVGLIKTVLKVVHTRFSDGILRLADVIEDQLFHIQTLHFFQKFLSY